MEIKTTYLEMFARPATVVREPRDGLAVVHVPKPTTRYYRYLYDSIGGAYHWSSRKKLSDAELSAILHDPRVEVHVLTVEGEPAGLAELDRRIPDDIEIVQFGLMPEFIGQGLGKYFLSWAVQRAWSYKPRRLWLHTCTLDHPNALPNYIKGGFTVFKEETKKREP